MTFFHCIRFKCICFRANSILARLCFYFLSCFLQSSASASILDSKDVTRDLHNADCSKLTRISILTLTSFHLEFNLYCIFHNASGHFVQFTRHTRALFVASRPSPCDNVKFHFSRDSHQGLQLVYGCQHSLLT